MICLFCMESYDQHFSSMEVRPGIFSFVAFAKNLHADLCQSGLFLFSLNFIKTFTHLLKSNFNTKYLSSKK